jgi:urease accessory protein
MLRFVLLLIAAVGSGSPALAHLDPAEHGSLMAGLTHPPSGVDHVLAMVMVGVWATLLGGRSLWLVPGGFVAAMAAGFAMAMAGVQLPFVEPAIVASVVVIGLLVAVALPIAKGVGIVLVTGFAVFHGYAHGGEMGAAGMLPYASGFILATIVLHAVGALASLLVVRKLGETRGRAASRAAGAAVAVSGVMLALA